MNIQDLMRSQKLALRSNPKPGQKATAIEKLGDAHTVVVAPSTTKAHQNGTPYLRARGNFETVVEVEAAEALTLFSWLEGEFNEAPVPPKLPPAADKGFDTTLLSHVTGGRDGFSYFLQEVTGYALMGLNDQKAVFVIYGPPHTGKTTFVSALLGAFGDYATHCASTPLLKHSTLEISNGLEVLEGARAAFVAEVVESEQLRVELIKKISGGDSIPIRGFRQASRNIEPFCKLFFTTNGHPNLPAHEVAAWARLVPLPFDCAFAGDTLDIRARDRLRHDPEIQRAVLAWGIAGAKRHFDKLRKFDVPECLWAQTARFFSEANPLEEFVKDALEPDAGEHIPAAVMQKAVRDWCELMGYGEGNISGRNLAAFLASKGIAKKRISRGYVYMDHELTLDLSDLEAA